MSVMRELRRRLSADRSPPPFDPCLPRLADRPPAGDGWIHEIKHDGFRILAHRRDRAVHLVSRNGHDLGSRFPQIVEAVRSLPVRSCVIDGEAMERKGASPVAGRLSGPPHLASPHELLTRDEARRIALVPSEGPFAGSQPIAIYDAVGVRRVLRRHIS